ncbi:MAG: SMC-Scp complex subunit ScpB [Gammaproteobacteria bacterium]|nr:SMC-Scp complex subunit ScpB [Gammaproteobacteria bacterium]
MSDVDNKVKMIVEGLLMAAGRPLTLDNIIAVFAKNEEPDRKELKTVMEAISADCGDRGFELKQVASGYRFQVKQDLSEWVAKLWEDRPPRYTRALLETLALIAYRQPITRGDIEEIRGVGVSANIIRTLLDREWIRVVGHRDVPGRPAMFATTKQFLDYFNLRSLQELPPLSEIKELAQTDQEFDLADELAQQRVIDLPEDVTDEASFEQNEAERAQLLEEEEALELSKKPLDEILKMGIPEKILEEEAGNEGVAEDLEDGKINADGDSASADVADNEAASDGQPGAAEISGEDVVETHAEENVSGQDLTSQDAGDELDNDEAGMPFSFSTSGDSGELADSDASSAVVETENETAEDSDEENQGAQILEFMSQDPDREADR